MSDYRTGQRPVQFRRRRLDEEVAPQLELSGRIKSLDDKDIITFMIPIDKVNAKAKRLVVIVTVPAEGEERDVVYVKQVK